MQCTSPVSIVNRCTGEKMLVPCGHCLACRLSKSREWSLRLLHESKYWSDSVFLTLTYSDDHLPLTNCGKMVLVKSDLQKFFKRLRKFISPKRIKYFSCGEYGDNFHRPHYHAIIFGLSPKDLSVFQRCWCFGFVKVGSVTPDSIGYVTGYVRKKLNGKKKIEELGYCVPSPFQLQSQGLGLSYCNDYDSQIADYGITMLGIPVSIPRYYGKKNELVYTRVTEYSCRSYADRLVETKRQNDAKFDLEIFGDYSKSYQLLAERDDRALALDQARKTLKTRLNLKMKGKL